MPVGGAEGVYEAGQNLAHTGHGSDEGVVHLKNMAEHTYGHHGAWNIKYYSFTYSSMHSFIPSFVNSPTTITFMWFLYTNVKHMSNLSIIQGMLNTLRTGDADLRF